MSYELVEYKDSFVIRIIGTDIFMEFQKSSGWNVTLMQELVIQLENSEIDSLIL